MIRPKRITSIVGARPQFIKHAILAKSLSQRFEVSLVHTLQHYDKSLNELVLDDLQIAGHQYLQLTNATESASRIERMTEALSDHLSKEKPDAVIVYGDTDTTLAGALASNKLEIPLVHVEAGERSFNDMMPEEHNRILTDRLSFMLCCSSQKSIDNLKREEISTHVYHTGDVMKDLLFLTEKKFNRSPRSHPYYYASVHRKYTQADKERLIMIFNSLNKLDYKVIFPLHPSTQKKIEEYRIVPTEYGNIDFIDPVSYSDSVQFQKFALAVMTDSGGMQKEAYWLKTPCITLRTETEWTETLEHGWNQLFYGNSDLLACLKKKPGPYDPLLYGDGNASEKIASLLSDLL